MKLNAKSQYALLFCFYLSRVARSTVHVACNDLGLSVSFMEQVCNALKRAGVLIPKRGPGGGYTLKEDATVLEALVAVGFIKTLTEDKFLGYMEGSQDASTLAIFSAGITREMNKLYQVKFSALHNVSNVKELHAELIAS